MTTKQIDILNIGLLLAAFVIAIKVPFELFLFAYAFLGPLHYLTEINWLHDKKYFVFNTKWVLLLVFLSFAVCFAPLMNELTQLPTFSSLREWFTNQSLFSFLYQWVTGFLFIGLISSVLFASVKNNVMNIIGVIVITIVAYFLMEVYLYKLIIGILLPTIIHVFLFTALFMLYGALKSNSFLGMLNVALLCILAYLISRLNINPSDYELSEETKQNFMYSTFTVVHQGIVQFLQLAKPGTPMSLLSAMSIKIQIFISFVYTYHYLNWFSKTSIIGWHKMEKSKLFTIGILWITSICLYLYHYKLGFMALLFLSMLHVFLEFPLNAVSIRGIASHFVGRK